MRLNFRAPPRLEPRDWLLTLVPLILWIAALYSRPWLIHPSCSAASPCQAFRVFFLDRPSIGIVSSSADFYSYVAQNSTAVIAAMGPVLFQIACAVGGRTAFPLALALGATDLVIFLQTWIINGFFTEGARLIAGRARPFLYASGGSTVDPVLFSDPQNYTSFYSGHTSFVTAACLFVLLTMLGRGASRKTLLAAGLIAQCLIISTGVFRILAGRHFLTDVLTAVVMGSIVSIGVAILHKNPRAGHAERNLLD